MIGFLSGIVRSIRGGRAIVLTSGVGYAVTLPKNLRFLPGESVDLFIHTHVREDDISLFGFKDEDSLSLFEELITVSGIGPKSALAVISSGPIESIKKAIQGSNLSYFTSVPGIGKKGAQKIILELKPKLAQTDADLASLEGNSELADALTGLGFAKNEILAVIPSVDMDQPLAEQIKNSLKLLRQ